TLEGRGAEGPSTSDGAERTSGPAREAAARDGPGRERTSDDPADETETGEAPLPSPDPALREPVNVAAAATDPVPQDRSAREPVKVAWIELTEPRGARVRLDGTWLDKKIPLKGQELEPGRHQIRVQKGTARWDLTFTIEPGERLDLTRRLKRCTTSR
ncbi:hypothetical protein L6R52_43755, partial [Myxococcota bacterium]|nr:hypothetical protein [Myxococcota bacterium]